MIKKIYSKHKETINNSIWRALQVAGKQGVIFIIFLLCAKFLVPYDFGVYNYSLAIIFFLILFGDFGISTATSKYVTEYNITDKEKLKSVLFNSGLIILGLTIIITILTLTIGPTYLKEKYVYVLYLLPLIFLAPMTSLYDGIYRGLKKFKQLAIMSLAVGVFSIGFVYILIKGYELVGALIAQNLFYLLLFLVLALGYREFHFKLNKEVIKEVGRYSFAYGIAILGNYLFIQFGILVLGHYSYFDEIAVYQLLTKIFAIIILPFTILGQVVAPNFTGFKAERKYSLIYEKLKKYTIYFFVIGIVLGILAYFVTPFVINAFLPEYYNSTFFQMLPFIIIIFISNVWAATVDAGILVPTGYASLMAKYYLILGIFGSVLSIILVNFLGYMGVVYSLTLCSFLMAVGLRILFFYKFRKLVLNI